MEIDSSQLKDLNIRVFIAPFGTLSFKRVWLTDDMPCSALVSAFREAYSVPDLKWFHHATMRILPEVGSATLKDLGVADGHVLFGFSGHLPTSLCIAAASTSMYQALVSRSVNVPALEREIEEWIVEHETDVDGFVEPFQGQQVIWVLKYISPKYLKAFLAMRRLMLATTPGFTWGDAVYVTPLRFPCSSMMYGRAGIMGFVSRSAVNRVFRADLRKGLALYQRWIPCQPRAYGLLTTTVHGDIANRMLRNRFCRRFNIDLVVFRPDQTNRDYVRRKTDLWFALYDWAGVSAAAGSTRPRVTSRIQGCKWVAIVGDEFERTGREIAYRNYFGEQDHRIVSQTGYSNQAALIQELHAAYRRSSSTNDVVLVKTDQ